MTEHFTVENIARLPKLLIILFAEQRCFCLRLFVEAARSAVAATFYGKLIAVFRNRANVRLPVQTIKRGAFQKHLHFIYIVCRAYSGNLKRALDKSGLFYAK